MKCFYRRFTIFGDKEGEMHTYDMYARELLRLAKKTSLIPFQGILCFQEGGNSIIALFSSMFF